MSALTDQVDALFAEWDKPDSPGCAVAIIRDGEMVYRRGYGCADLEHGVPISPDSVFDIASTSKQFTAMCIALLQAGDTLAGGPDKPTHPRDTGIRFSHYDSAPDSPHQRVA